MPTVLDALLNDPDDYAATLDGDHVAFRQMDRASYARSIFLDQRIEAVDSLTRRVPIDPLMAGMRHAQLPHRSIGFVFHVAHCGSTLLARALDRPNSNLVLREPLLLRQLGVLAAAENMADPPRPWRSLAELAWTLLSKRYRRGEPVIVKANVPVNFMLSWLLEYAPETKAILLYLGFEDYLLAVLRSNYHRAWILQVGGELYPALTELIDPLEAMEPAYVAAALWLAQMRIFADALDRHHRVRSLDAETFFSEPANVIAAAFAHYGIAVSQVEVDAIVAGPLFATYAKNPQVAFDDEARRRRRAAALAELGDEVADARRWLDRKLVNFPLPTALDRPLVGAGHRLL